LPAYVAITPDEHRPSNNLVLFYRIVTPITWLLTVITSAYYTFRRPHEGGHQHDRHRIWRQNDLHHTPFSLNSIVISVYWIIIYILQIPYLYNLYTPPALVTPAMILAPFFTFNNLLAFGFVHLWCRGYFWWALLLAAVNWLNLTFAYFRFPKSPVLMHIAVITGPLAWAFATLFWDGAAAFGAHKVPARIVANVFVWTWAVYGGFYLVAFKDWSMGFCLSIMACGKSSH
jgi:Fungal protein of unknown function (DUF1774)